jgi:predicted LPLAT superfamily acyltransferase
MILAQPMAARMKPTHWAEHGREHLRRGHAVPALGARVFGRLPFRLCLYPVVLYYWLTRGTARRASLDYLRRLHASRGVPARAPGRRASLAHLMFFAETLLDKTWRCPAYPRGS